jgi:hypothetical protein
MVDNFIRTSSRLITLMQQTGFCHFFAVLNGRLSATGIQLALPVWHAMASNHYLYRIVFDGLVTNPTSNTSGVALTDLMFSIKPWDPEFSTKEGVSAKRLIKLGISGRHMINAEFILGSYCLLDIPLDSKSHVYPLMINSGIESIWLRHFTVMGDVVFSPKNCLDHYAKQFYKGSVKIGVLKPQIIDLFIALSCVKYPDYDPFMTGTISIKSRLPIKNWGIDKFFNGGFGIAYSKRGEGIFNAINFRISAYLQLNFLTHPPRNAIQDYLVMPIDRYSAVPYHPANHPGDFRLLVDKTDLRNPEARAMLHTNISETMLLFELPRNNA